MRMVLVQQIDEEEKEQKQDTPEHANTKTNW